MSTDGWEKIRVDLKEVKITKITKENMQLNGNRNYFKEAEKLKKDEVYVSAIDLNRERGKIEVIKSYTLEMIEKDTGLSGKTPGTTFRIFLPVKNLPGAVKEKSRED